MLFHLGIVKGLWLCYDTTMKRDTLKEIGKYFLDISKIFLALTLITPFMKAGKISITAIVITIIVAGLGIYFTDKGAKDE
jgi:Na+/melibiose symporter-like transporter